MVENKDSDMDTKVSIMDSIRTKVAAGGIAGNLVIASEEKMKQIVNNVGNAYKATGKPVQVRYDNNGVQISLNTEAEKVSLYADNGSDSLLLDGSDSGKGTHKFINDMSWIYNNLYQKLKN